MELILTQVGKPITMFSRHARLYYMMVYILSFTTGNLVYYLLLYEWYMTWSYWVNNVEKTCKLFFFFDNNNKNLCLLFLHTSLFNFFIHLLAYFSNLIYSLY